jgi:GTP:adenosylcobinamide-phosphate guanylyltransferase
LRGGALHSTQLRFWRLANAAFQPFGPIHVDTWGILSVENENEGAKQLLVDVIVTVPVARWTAIVLAGQRPGEDPLAKHFGQEWKALIPVGGKQMVTRVLETLHATPEIGQIVVLAQQPAVLQHAVEAGGGATIITSSAGISDSIRQTAGREEAPWPVFVTTADHPLLTPAMVSAFLAQAGGADLAVGMVERRVFEASYHDNKRTWLKLSDGHWSGANLFALNTVATRNALDLWAEVEQDRKRVWKIFLRFGPWLAFRALTRSIGLVAALDKAGRRLGLTAKLVAMPFAEAAIDVDKPSDHALAESILAARD